MNEKKRAFISYARHDGDKFAAKLSKGLMEHGFSLWRDLSQMEGGRGWWDQIVEALQNVEYLLLVLTPRALESSVVQREWRTARQLGVCVIPVAGCSMDQLDLALLPRWMADVHIVDIDVREQWDRLVMTLQSECRAPRVPFMAGPLPNNFVARPKEFDELVTSLLIGERDRPVAATATLQGAGGYGKTTLAKAVCHDERIQEEFHDGILWVDLGQAPGDATPRVIDLIEILTRDRPRFANAKVAGARLGELLGDQDILLVIDDVWTRFDAEPFLMGGARTARLITTRMQEALPGNARSVHVDEMRLDESLELLRSGLPSPGEEARLWDLARRLGRAPQLLALVNSALRQRCRQGDSVNGAIAYVTTKLERRGVTGFDAQDKKSRENEVATTLDLSFELLDSREQARFHELSIFPQDAAIPLAMVTRLWGATSSLDEFETEELCLRLFGLSLLSDCDLKTRTIRLHEIIRSYLHSETTEKISEWNTLFLCDAPSDLLREPTGTNAYFWSNLAFHLMEAGQKDKLRELLEDYRYLQRKLEMTGPAALITDFQWLGEPQRTEDIEGTIRLSANILAHHPEQLAAQLYARIALDGRIAESIRTHSKKPWIRPLHPTFTRPGGPLIWTLEGHTAKVTTVAVTPDGQRVISGAGVGDGTLKVWDLATGREILILRGHYVAANVVGVAVTPDSQRAVSGSYDGTIRIWDLTSGHEVMIIQPAGPLRVLVMTPDGRYLVSGEWRDNSLKVWDLISGCEFRTFPERSKSVSALAVTPDSRRLVSGGDDGNLEVLDLTSGHVVLTMQGDPKGVSALAVTPNGQRVISGSLDCIQIWDLNSGLELLRITGNFYGVTALAVTPDGRYVVSGSEDYMRGEEKGRNAVRVWDLVSGRERNAFYGHSLGVTAVAVTPDGRYVVSGSNDTTLKVWDLTYEGEHPNSSVPKLFPDYAKYMYVLVVAPDGRRVISAFVDHALKVWDLHSGRVLLTLEGHAGLVTAVAVTSDNQRVVSASCDDTLKVWDLASGRELLTIEGYCNWPSSDRPTAAKVVLTPDGRRAVSSSRRGLIVWDLASGHELCTLQNSEPRLQRVAGAVAVTADGQRVVSGSRHGLIVWDLVSGHEILNRPARVPQITWDQPHHPSPYQALIDLAVTPDGQRAVSTTGDLLKVWSLSSRAGAQSDWRGSFDYDDELPLEGHSGLVTAVAVTPDGRRAVSGSRDGTLKLWDLASASELLTLDDNSFKVATTYNGQRAHSGYVTALAVTPDGRYAISGSGDRSIILWNLELGAEVFRLDLETERTVLALSPDGHMIVAGDRLGHVHFFQIESNF